MTAEFKFFRHSETGKVERLPAHFGMFPQFEEVPSEAYECVDCFLETTPEPEPLEAEVYTIEYESEDED